MLQKMIMPEYVRDFVCTAADCPSSCCYGWRIDLNPEIYNKYQKCKDLEWRDRFLNNIVKQENSDKYTVKYREDGYCIFIDEQNMCSIQRRFGESFLSNVCRTFPRVYFALNNIVEKICTLGCPEILRSVLFSDKKVKLVLSTEKADGVATKIEPKSIYSRKEISLIRDFTIGILQKEYYSINEKMLILAYFFESFRQSEKVDVAKLIESFKLLVESKQIKPILDQIKVNRLLHVEMMQKIMNSAFRFSDVHKFNDDCEKFYYAIKLDKNDGIEYFDLYHSHSYQDFLKKYPYMFENYFVHSVLFDCFPAKHEDLWDGFLELAIKYALFNVFLLGYHVENKGVLEENDFLKIMSAHFARATDATHPSVIGNACQILKKFNCTDINNVFAILKV